jgi:hypothetical protein
MRHGQMANCREDTYELQCLLSSFHTYLHLSETTYFERGEMGNTLYIYIYCSRECTGNMHVNS